MTNRIDDYALIGDGRSAALIDKSGAIEWLCLPRFDAPACIASMLGKAENGIWRMAPTDERFEVARRYRRETLILETRFTCSEGTVSLTDFMAIDQPEPCVVRIVRGLSGSVNMRMHLALRFDYGRLVPWVTRDPDGALSFVAGPHLLLLRTPAEHHGEGLATVAEFRIGAGEVMPFSLGYGRSFDPHPESFDPAEAERRAEQYWRDWAGRCNYQGAYRDAVTRSLITLKALTYRVTGGMVAAATTSLPELPAGTRNWDYRFCWLRDSTFTLLAFLAAGYEEEAEAWRAWLVRAAAGSAAQLQPLYTVLGENRIDEWEVPWLDGFNGAKPVRIGNAAFAQLQLDVYGEILDALHHARRSKLAPNRASWDLQQALLKQLENMADAPDRGIWEARDGDRHYTHSKVMMWVAFDRGVQAVEQFGLEGPVGRWRAIRDRLHSEICEKGYDESLGSFVRAYGERELDAATLLIPLVGFLPATDARVIGTVQAIEARLTDGGLVRRYDTASADDGLPPGEGLFLPCSFWLADNLILQGRREEGERLFQKLLDIRNDVGLLAEEFDTTTGTHLGNFPQALCHLALVGTAYNLQGQKGPAQVRGEEETAATPEDSPRLGHPSRPPYRD
jgi:GH15 family glucan-1,4-alpha-glucosidase